MPRRPTGRNTIRRTGMTLPGATAVSFDYISTGGRLDDAASRVTRVGVDTAVAVKVPVAQYEYLGAARLVGTDLLQPKARSNYFEGAVSGTPYPDLDRFNRVEHSRWTSYKGTGTRNFYDVDVAYDPASNILGVTDNVHKSSAGNRNFDALYTIDALNRLTRADEGTLSWSGGTGTISNRSRDERWLDASGNLALSQTGNWLRRRLDLNGDGNFTGTNELDDTGVFSLANELKTRDTDSNGTPNYTLAYDKTGNQTADGLGYGYTYDAFGRLVAVHKETDTGVVYAQYRYNGLGFRIGWRYDTSGNGYVDAGDPWYYFCYDDAWRIVATFRAADADPKEVFVYHNAGFGGYGGSSYIDSAILRDKEVKAKWTEEATEEREERRYYCQNWRADVSAILTDSGSMVEWVKYSSYGVPFALPAGDTDSDGDWDAADSAAITGAYDVRQDANLDGAIGAADVTHANSITGGYQTLGRGILSSSAVANRKGYAGYEYDPTFEGAGRHLYHVRHRVYNADVGRWLRRDPLGYVDGMSLYSFVQGLAIIAADPWGLFICVGGCQVPAPPPVNPGGGGGPPLCAGGTCSVPIVPGPDRGTPGPIICVGGTCTVPAFSPPWTPACPSHSGGGAGSSPSSGGGAGGGFIVGIASGGAGARGGAGQACGAGGSGSGPNEPGRRFRSWHLNPDWTNLDDLPLENPRVGSGPRTQQGQELARDTLGAAQVAGDFLDMAACMAACIGTTEGINWGLGKIPLPGYRRPGRDGPPAWNPTPAIGFDPFDPWANPISLINCSLLGRLAPHCELVTFANRVRPGGSTQKACEDHCNSRTRCAEQ